MLRLLPAGAGWSKAALGIYTITVKSLQCRCSSYKSIMCTRGEGGGGGVAERHLLNHGGCEICPVRLWCDEWHQRVIFHLQGVQVYPY